MYDPKNMPNPDMEETSGGAAANDDIAETQRCDVVQYEDADNNLASVDPELTPVDNPSDCEPVLPVDNRESVDSCSSQKNEYTENSAGFRYEHQPQAAQQPIGYAYPAAHNYEQQNKYAYPKYNSDEPKKRKSKGKVAFLTITCILLVVAVGFFAIVATNNNTTGDRNNGLSEVPFISPVSSADADEEGLTAAEVYQKVFKSSVSILAYQQSTGELGVLGSGVICQEDENNIYTYIVTCAHVINDTDYNIKVELWDGSVHTAEVVNYDDSNDIGVIRIRATGMQIAEFGDSDELQPGATVYAIGSPYSSKFAGTFTRGMVSAVNRLVTTQTSYQLCCIQHDAPINHGNSGGALVNAYGQIVGINALKITAEGYEGLGFSVPSTTVIKVINAIIETGIAPKAPKLGISYVQAIYYSQFLSDLVEKENLPAGSIVIADINKDSSLYNTELQVNDIVTAVNGENLTSPDLLVQLIQNSNVGDSFELSVVRIIMNEDGTDYVDIKTFTVTATLVEKSDSDNGKEQNEAQEDFYEYFGDDSGDYEDFYEYFYDYFYGGGNFGGNEEAPQGDNRFTIPE